MCFNCRDYNEFTEHTCSLKKASYDQANGEYMVDSDTIAVVNFDEVSDKYAENHKIPSRCSVDALCNSSEGSLVMIEFKNGNIDGTEKYTIYRKIYDSLLIVSDITELKLSDYRKHAVFILVFNREKNPNAKGAPASISGSPSLGKMADLLACKARKSMIYFGLESFRGYCFRDVITVDVSKFNAQCKNLLGSC